jgi:hypothetical protein
MYILFIGYPYCYLTHLNLSDGINLRSESVLLLKVLDSIISDDNFNGLIKLSMCTLINMVSYN